MNGKISKMYIGIVYFKKNLEMNVVLCLCFRNNILVLYFIGGGN